jgi:hypothetical protein
MCRWVCPPETGLAYRYERVSPFQGSTLTPEHIERNPLGKIPTLRDVNGVDIAESHAICRYLAKIYPEAQKFYPSDDPMLCAQVDAKNDFITFSIAGPFFNWFVVSGYFPKAWKLKIEKEAYLSSLFCLLSKMYILISQWLENGAIPCRALSTRFPVVLMSLVNVFRSCLKCLRYLFRDNPITGATMPCERPVTVKYCAKEELEQKSFEVWRSYSVSILTKSLRARRNRQY